MAGELRRCGCGKTIQKEPLKECVPCPCGKTSHSKFSLEQHKFHKTKGWFKGKLAPKKKRINLDRGIFQPKGRGVMKLEKEAREKAKRVRLNIHKSKPAPDEGLKAYGIPLDDNNLIVSIPESDLRQLALDMRNGLVCTSGHVPNNSLKIVFAPLAKMSDDEIRRLIKSDVGLIYEYVDKAVEKVDKFPIFTSMCVLNKEDTFKLGVFYNGAWKGHILKGGDIDESDTSKL